MAAAGGNGFEAMVMASTAARGIEKTYKLRDLRTELEEADRKTDILHDSIVALENDPEVVGLEELFEELVNAPRLFVSPHQVKDTITVKNYGYPGDVYAVDPRTKKRLSRGGVTALDFDMP